MVNTILLIGLGAPEIILIVVALLLLFGGKKIPELMRGLGRGVKEFKEGKDGDGTDPVKENDPKKY
ncbi:twin-arginine translocase TatA/TatE family subunit [Arcticibacter eurypsychrophilus]|uniref:twin-arginine translocase TatA/TatE family subunit n=1 Tax=Arcticibacter eurypsychrophilus TaxID=1434752 RepID=UPI00084D50BC|nr:twin-arginine translocase TatA/TatE family subunit [Arcticibacter eurypsychrophilus]